MKVKYKAQDSGRTLINNLSLVPGVEYTVTEKDVRYAFGVQVIGKELAEKLLEKGLLEKVEEAPVAEAKDATPALPKKAESKETAAAKEG